MKKTIISAFLFTCMSATAMALTTNDHSKGDTINQGGKGGDADADATALSIAGAESSSWAMINSYSELNSYQQSLQGQGQSQNMTGSNNAKQSQSVTFEAVDYIAPLASVPAIDTRNPELMLNAEAAMIEAARAEIAATTGKGFTSGYSFSDDGVTAVVAYNASAYTVHVYPTGAAKGITPAVLERVAVKAISKIKAKTFSLAGQYISIENHSNGFGAGANNAGSLANADRGLVGGVAAALTGNRGRTSQRVRIELVFEGRR